ncbi:MAG: hypothetical protein GY780_02980 [bacterium]|nr:hypothetical protein [bacterium]
MKINKDQFEALAYIFEKNNGNTLGPFENKVIDESGLKDTPVQILADAIVDNLSEDYSEDISFRSEAYWALSKRFDNTLIPFFRARLKNELSVPGVPAVFQLMIALDNINEPVFGKDRDGSYAAHDVELNIRDARVYLKKTAGAN